MKQFPTFDSLIEKEAGELLQMLTDHGLKFPKDNYYMSHINENQYTQAIYLVGEKQVIRMTGNLLILIYLKGKDEEPFINMGKDTSSLLHKMNSLPLHNPIGPSIVIWSSFGIFIKYYFLDNVEFGEKQFHRKLINQRIKLING